jgi:hypothetical protein
MKMRRRRNRAKYRQQQQPTIAKLFHCPRMRQVRYHAYLQPKEAATGKRESDMAACRVVSCRAALRRARRRRTMIAML